MTSPETTGHIVHKAAVTIAVVLFALLFVAALYYVFDVIMLVFAAVLLAIFLRGLAELLSYYVKVSDGWLVLLVSLILLALVAGFIALLSPSVAEQVGLLRDKIPASVQKVSDYLNQYGWGRTLLENLPSYQSVVDNINATGLMTRVGGFFTSTIGVLGNIAIVLLLAIYFASEPKMYLVGFVKLFPRERRERVKEVIHGVYQTLRWWLIGKAGSMLFIGLLTWIGLWILGVPLALTLGLLAGLLSFIPNFGPIISAVPAILLAFIDSPITALYVLGLFVLVQLIESNIVTPFIERETVELPPALTITFQLALGVLVGGLGLVLATPLLAAVVVAVQMLYIEDVLGDASTAGALEGSENVDEVATDSLAESTENA
jgi:predicted PurR-regulated permease PerM